MPKFAAYSPDATRLLREKTGSVNLDCFVYIDPEQERESFVLVRYPERIAHISFAEIEFDPGSFTSLMEGVYKVIYG